MQRLTKYSLLLKAVLKKTDDANQKKDLVEMVKLFLFWFFILSNLTTFICRTKMLSHWYGMSTVT